MHDYDDQLRLVLGRLMNCSLHCLKSIVITVNRNWWIKRNPIWKNHQANTRSPKHISVGNKEQRRSRQTVLNVRKWRSRFMIIHCDMEGKPRSHGYATIEHKNRAAADGSIYSNQDNNAFDGKHKCSSIIWSIGATCTQKKDSQIWSFWTVRLKFQRDVRSTESCFQSSPVDSTTMLHFCESVTNWMSCNLQAWVNKAMESAMVDVRFLLIR